MKISNVEFTVSRDAGFVANNCEKFDISNCKFTCCRIAADIKGRNMNIDSCTVCFNAAGGIILDGGNEDTLEPANSKISNSEFFKNTARKHGNTFALRLFSSYRDW